MTATDYPIREIFRRFYPEYRKTHPFLSREAEKTAACITHCKTGELGYDVSFCEDCGRPRIHAVSCNNRSCPCCQAPLEKKWELERNTELVSGIAYFHVVFTVPHELNDLIRTNQKIMLDLQFRCVQETLLSLCADPKFLGAKPGIIAVLHTWGQTLSFHPHVHACLSGGGLTPAGQFVEAKHKGFFLPEAVMASSFRGRYLSGLKKLYESSSIDLTGQKDLQDPNGWKAFINSLFSKKWIPFIKETFNGKGNAIRYLARYSFRTAIANSRIVEVTDTHVTFRYKDYSDGNREKLLTVKGTDFIDMFLQHILPRGFNRVRFSGYLTNSRKSANLKLIHRLRNTVFPGNPYRTMHVAELIMTLYGKDICRCPECSGRMIRFSRGMPAEKLPPHLIKHLSEVS